MMHFWVRSDCFEHSDEKYINFTIKNQVNLENGLTNAVDDTCLEIRLYVIFCEIILKTNREKIYIHRQPGSKTWRYAAVWTWPPLFSARQKSKAALAPRPKVFFVLRDFLYFKYDSIQQTGLAIWTTGRVVFRGAGDFGDGAPAPPSFPFQKTSPGP